MASVHDVAAYILDKSGPMSHMKLQKLVYYCQAWSLVWDEEPLFPERIEAWVSGPVVPSLFAELRKLFRVVRLNVRKGDPKKLTAQQRETVDAVLGFYAKKDPQWLSDLTHMEAPWQKARKGLKADERGRREITRAALAEYYGSL
jgi:uncharacterized phage-associated protein